MRWRAPAAELPLPNGGVITPSNINPWRGQRAEGARWTYGQLHAMSRHGLDSETCAGITVRSRATSREMWWPSTEETPVFVFECPVIRQERGRVLVISPAGMAKLVYADGKIVKDRK